MAIDKRIKEERARLGYSQAAFAALAGKSHRSQTGWEQGRACPDAQVLACWAAAGADVGYILTGRLSAPVATDEAELLRLYRIGQYVAGNVIAGTVFICPGRCARGDHGRNGHHRRG